MLSAIDFSVRDVKDEEGLLIKPKYISGHSFDITDLIEVGDIVKIYDVLNNDVLYIWSEDMLKALKEDVKNGIGIESILTREQFAQAEYKIPEEN